MLQFTIINHPNMPVTEQANMAVEAGCGWIEINPALIESTLLEEIISTCKKAEVILTFIHDDTLLEKHRVHGIHLSAPDAEPVALRERLGGHPIIGVDVVTTPDLNALKRADADYVVLPGYPGNCSIETITTLCDNMEQTGIHFPIVVEGVIPANSIQAILDAGASAVKIDIRSLVGPHYRTSLSSYMKLCSSARR